MADEPIIEGVLVEENDVISEKVHAYTENHLDESGNIGEASIGIHVASSQVSMMLVSIYF